MQRLFYENYLVKDYFSCSDAKKKSASIYLIFLNMNIRDSDQ